MMNQAYDRVIQTTRLILRRVPEGSKPYAEANYYLGLALGVLQDFEGSREALSKTLEADPRHASAWYNRALSHRLLLRTGEALRDVERAIELEDRNLMMLPAIRKTGPPASMRIEEPWRERKLEQSVQFFEQKES
jgi:tetratricopeptide (TPR) repeat protein